MNDLYVALCLVTWLACCVALLAWAHGQIIAGKSLPTRLWWIEYFVRYVTKR